MRCCLYVLTIVHLWIVTLTHGSEKEYSRLPESYGIGSNDDMVDWSRHPCRRPCKNRAKPLICRYGFTVEFYSTMSKACYDCPFNATDCSRRHCIVADGNEKVVIVANRQLPGPAIEVCMGDRIIVDVTNGLMTDTTTIHWHGLHQRETPFMDGVPYITQCPILPGQTYRYDFLAHKAGSYIWHSHSGQQRADGLFGALIIRAPDEKNPIKKLYDEDRHLIVLKEWAKTSAHEVYVLDYQSGIKLNPHTILVNGLGRHGGQDDNETSSMVPVAVFHVEKGKRYRFRLLNIGSKDCPMDVKIEGHEMLVVSGDGADIEPVEVDSIRILAGERYDFILSADREIENYPMLFRGGINCKPLNCHQIAILKYKGAPDDIGPALDAKYNLSEPYNDTRQLNPFDQGTETPNSMCIPNLNALEPDDDGIMGKPDHQLYVAFNFYEIDNHDYHRKNLYGFYQVKKSTRSRSMQFNHITFKMPNFSLLTRESVESDNFCNSTTARNCNNEHCHCSHVLNVELDSLVEMVFIDEGLFQLNHPIHLHGYSYRVVAMEKISNSTITIEDVKALDKSGKIRRKLRGAPSKDTVMVPSGGYTIVRFRANNPGYWFLHCHFDEHSTNGMAAILKVGQHKDFPAVPKSLPRC